MLVIGLLGAVNWATLALKKPEKPAEPLAPAVTIPEVKIPEVSFISVGDVMLARKLNRLIDQNGIDYPFLQVKEMLASADITFTNLESPLSTQGKKLPGKGIWFRGNPENVEALLGAGFDVVSLANNHALDYDSPALLETLDLLRSKGIQPVGAGKDINEARSAGLVEAQGIKFAFLAYSEMADMFWSYQYPRRLKATQDTPGIAPLVTDDVAADIAAVRPEVDYVIVSLHWGVEYQHLPEDYQRELAHKLIDAGADVVIGHHPHCLQGVEVYKQGLIAYSLGNFVFDQNWSEKTKEGLLLRMTFTPAEWENAELLPVYINDGQPVVAEAAQAKDILNLTRDASEKLGTKLEIDQGKAMIKRETEEGALGSTGI